MAGCQQPFLSKMAGDNQLSAAIFSPKWLVTTGCQQPSPCKAKVSDLDNILIVVKIYAISIELLFVRVSVTKKLQDGKS